MGKVIKFSGNNKNSDYVYHCDLCSCPIEQWEPLDTYKSDRSCEVESDFTDVINGFEEMGHDYGYNDILNKCLKFKEEYPDIKDFEETVKEMINIGLDTGEISQLYLG